MCYIWDKNDYITETESQLKIEVVYKKVTFKEVVLCDLVAKSNGFLKNLRQSRCMMERKGKYFSYKNRKIGNWKAAPISPNP